MLDFLRKFAYEGFVPGDYTDGTLHILSIILVIASITFFSLYFKNKDPKKMDKVFKIISIVALSIYVFRRSFWVINGQNFFEAYWPFYLCNVNTIFFSLYQIFGWKKGKDFFLVTGLIGGIFTFLMPNGIYDDKYLTLPVIDSVLSHYVIVVIPLVLLITKNHILKPKGLISVFIGLIIVTINVEFVQRLLFNTQNDYLFFRSNMPFTISGVPQFYIISSLAIVLVLGVYLINYLLVNRHRVFKLSYKH